MIRFQIIFIMFIYLTLQGLQEAVKLEEGEINEKVVLSEDLGSHISTQVINQSKGTTRSPQILHDENETFSKDETSANGSKQQLLPATASVTLNSNRKEHGDKNNVNSSSWNSVRGEEQKSSTTDFSKNSSDFNAKDNNGNSSINPSQQNVPEKNENKINSLDDLDHLSFINNVSNKSNARDYENKDAIQLMKEVEENENENDSEEKFFEKDQKDLLMQVTDYGLEEMNKLYNMKEKEIYEAGFLLATDNPGSYLAAFNPQTDELKKLSQYGYAALKASARLKEELASSKLRQELLNVTEESTKDFPEISLLDTSLHEDCPLKNNPRCPPWRHLFRTADGTCNNRNHPWWGAKFQQLKRFLAPHYSDGLEGIRESVRGGTLPSPRVISTEVHWDKDITSKSLTHMLMLWGQFIDHDMTSSSQSRGFNRSVPKCCNVPVDLLHPDCLPIEVPPNDPFFSQFGVRCLEFLRSAPSSRRGCGLGPREQINQVTSYIDGSMIYGNSEREASKLRLFRNGMLKYTRMPQRLPLLPTDREKGESCRGPNSDFLCFDSGDTRMTEQPGLLAIHVIFLRLHNRLTRNLAHLNPQWSDERLYQETRKIVGAILQHITYREFLPIILGPDVMKIFDIKLSKDGYYNGYSDKVSATAANGFATAAFRFGHSLVQGRFLKWDDIRKEPINNVTLHEELEDPAALHRFGAVDSIMLGMCIQGAQKNDEHFTTELTNHLFQTPKFPAGMDLASINIQRGRDHGLPSYNSWRNPCGLRKLRTWDDLLHVMSEESRDGFRRVYRDVDDIDLYAGGLAEFPVRGGIVGSTFSCIIAQNFRNLRKGDRFWYENGGFSSSFTVSQLKAIRRVTLARILCDNLDLIESIQPFVFLTEDNLRNPRIPCRSRDIPFFDLTPWEESPKGKWTQQSDSDKDEPLPETPENKPEPTTRGTEFPTPID